MRSDNNENKKLRVGSSEFLSIFWTSQPHMTWWSDPTPLLCIFILWQSSHIPSFLSRKTILSNGTAESSALKCWKLNQLGQSCWDSNSLPATSCTTPHQSASQSQFWSLFTLTKTMVRYNRTANLPTDWPLSWKLPYPITLLITLLIGLLDKRYQGSHWIDCLYPQTIGPYWSLAVSSFFPEPCSTSHSSPRLFWLAQDLLHWQL